jgi:bifunctional non-homologous end joining protein LigD
MALEKYKAKRDFTESPEPSGDTPHKSPGGRTARFFCVQKHLASHLHYDFRLEHNGVLLSWAVPKGPALDPATKRLAMHVEDHPFDYGEFEGVIPSGYGAGIVMLWDRGTWTPEVDDVDAALKKGDLKFTLDGFKLKGSWVLVRTKGGRWGGSGGGDDRSWLLIKHRDAWAGSVDITEFAPLSVKSGGDFADILSQENPSIWQSHRPAQGGEAGAMFKRIVERALEMRGAQGVQSAGSTVAEEAPGSLRPARKKPAVRTRAATKNPGGARSASATRAAKSTAARKPSATKRPTARKRTR